MNPAPKQDSTPEDASLPPAGTRLLLVVEDDRTTLTALRRIFTRLGWDVRTASTVAEGLDLLNLRPQGLILDLMLPDGDGLQVLRRIRAENLPTRVALTTGVVDGEWLDRARELHPDGLIRKPVEFAVLLRVFDPAQV